VNYDANDRFCLDGERLIRIDQTLNYGAPGQKYRTEHESFTKIESSGGIDGDPATFTAWTKSGQIMYFGNTIDSAVEGNGTGKKRLWALSRVEDRAGNYLRITYYENAFAAGEHQPYLIEYTGNSVSAPYATVTFSYVTRSDTFKGYEAGSIIQSTTRLAAITTKVGSAIVKSYNLAYQPALSPSTSRSRLASVQECDPASTCLPATSFTWQDTTSSFTNTGTWGTGLDSASTQNHVGDFNGDGKNDVVAFKDNGTSWVLLSSGPGAFAATQWGVGHNTITSRNFLGDFNGDLVTDVAKFTDEGVASVWISTGSGFTAGSIWATGLGAIPENWRGSDVNGDGRTDVIAFRSAGINAGKSEVWLSIGSGFVYNGIWGTGHNTNTARNLLGDFNGDGLTDALKFVDEGIATVWLSTGLGFTAGATWVTGLGTVPENWQLGDVNGDGLTDIVAFRSGGALAGSSEVWFSTGAAFVYAGVWGSGHNTITSRNFLQDVNSDGKVDAVKLEDNGNATVWISTGNVFQSGVLWASGLGAVPQKVKFGDFSGDGKVDLMLINASGVASGFISSGAMPDQLLSINTGINFLTSLTYKPLTDSTVYLKDAGGAWPISHIQAPSYAVSNITTGNGIGGTNSTSYRYEGLKAHALGLGLLGFRATTESSVDTGITTTTTFAQNNVCSFTHPVSGYTSYACIAMPLSATTSRSGVTLNSSTATPTFVSTYPGAYFSYASIATANSYVANDALTGSTLVSSTNTVTEFSELTQYGNATKITVTDNIAGYVQTSINNYDNDQTSWILGRLRCAAVTKTLAGGASPQTRTSSFTYDSLKGFLLSETIEPGTSCVGAPLASTDAKLRLTTTYGYDGFGNKTSVSTTGGISGNVSYVEPRTSYTYFDTIAGCTAPAGYIAGRFPVRGVNALGQVECYEYDFRFGARMRLTGPNGAALATNWTYDGFGRMSTETRADGTATGLTYNVCVPSTWCAYQVTATSTGMPATYDFYDSLNRLLAHEQVAFDGGLYIEKNITYDSFGRVSNSYRPYIYGQSAFATSFSYDALGRMLTSTAPNNLVTNYSYSGFTTTVTVINSTGAQTTSKVVNTQGWTTSTTDAAGKVTNFTHDPHGNLLTTTDPKLNKVIMTYDLKGRKTGMNDPDMGAWTYIYDALGQLKSQTDAKAQTTTMVYDLLGRMTQRNEPSLVSNYTYDKYANNTACNKGIGKLCEVTAGNGYRRVHTYDALGRPAQSDYYTESTTVPFQVNTTYGVAGDTTCPNSHGKVCTVTYPAVTIGTTTTRLQVKNSYNAAGYLFKITRLDTGNDVWTATAMDADGHVTHETLGNLLGTVRTYEGTTGRLLGISTGNGATQNMGFEYDSIGNLTKQPMFSPPPALPALPKTMVMMP
jgi:YD repeat-containing protein